MSSSAQVQTARRVAAEQQAAAVGHREAGVDDVVDQQHGPALEVAGRIAEQQDLARAFLALAVAGEAHKFDPGQRARPAERPRQIGQEHEAALEHADHGQLAADRGHDLGRERLDPGGDLGLAEQLLDRRLAATLSARTIKRRRPVGAGRGGALALARGGLLGGF